jgi:hypothetical protein
MSKGATRKSRRSVFAFTAAAALAAALPALGAAGPPLASGHSNFTTAPHPANFCGVPGTAYERVVEQFKVSEGSELGTFRSTQVFTVSATGKSIESSSAGVSRATITANGDGTITFEASDAGLALQFKTGDGRMLQLADGGPIRSAGTLKIRETIDAATGDTLSFEVVAERGTHLLFEGADICGPVIDYLSSP